MSVVIIILALFLYFLPAIVALNNKKTNAASIFIVNIFCFVIPVIGWVVCLAWAVAKDKPRDIVQIFDDRYEGNSLGYHKRNR